MSRTGGRAPRASPHAPPPDKAQCIQLCDPRRALAVENPLIETSSVKLQRSLATAPQHARRTLRPVARGNPDQLGRGCEQARVTSVCGAGGRGHALGVRADAPASVSLPPLALGAPFLLDVPGEEVESMDCYSSIYSES